MIASRPCYASEQSQFDPQAFVDWCAGNNRQACFDVECRNADLVVSNGCSIVGGVFHSVTVSTEKGAVVNLDGIACIGSGIDDLNSGFKHLANAYVNRISQWNNLQAYMCGVGFDIEGSHVGCVHTKWLATGCRKGIWLHGRHNTNSMTLNSVRCDSCREFGIIAEWPGEIGNGGQHQLVLNQPIVEGNRGGGFLFRSVGVVVNQPWTEQNGRDGKNYDYELDSNLDKSIDKATKNYVVLRDPKFSTDGKNDNVRIKFLNGAQELRVEGGIASSKSIIDGNGHSWASMIRLNQCPLQVANFPESKIVSL